jgi:hypothetical protein
VRRFAVRSEVHGEQQKWGAAGIWISPFPLPPAQPLGWGWSFFFQDRAPQYQSSERARLAIDPAVLCHERADEIDSKGLACSVAPPRPYRANLLDPRTSAEQQTAQFQQQQQQQQYAAE